MTATTVPAATTPESGLFSGPQSLRVPAERRTALFLIVSVPVTLAVIKLVFHGVTPTQVALLFVVGMVLVSLNRGRLLGSGIRVRRQQFPDVIDVVEWASRRLGVAPPQVFIRDDFFVPANAIGLGEPYALVISSQYLQLFDDRDQLAFVVGRELGHIANGNTRLSSLIVASGRSNPIVASLFGGWLRQTEYSADRAGLLCSSLDAAVKAIAVTTFHASGKIVEAAMLADQRTDLESDIVLRFGEVMGMMPYAVNRVRALENFAAGPLYAYWMQRLVTDPLPVRAALGPADGPVDRRELVSNLRRGIALLIDLAIIGVIVDAVIISTGNTPASHVHGLHFTFLNVTNIQELAKSNPQMWYFVYAAILVGAAGRTIGMMLLDIHVVTVDHGRVGIWRAILRYVVALFSVLLVVPALWGFITRLHVHDRLSKTRLVGTRFR